MTYALIDVEGVVENLIVWDGSSQWTPPEGLAVREVLPGDIAIIGGKFVAAADVPPASPDVTSGDAPDQTVTL